jgi:uncharacterized membrane protein YkvA (DUF1232 family)
MEENLPIRRIEEAESYGSYYDESRFWKKVKQVARKLGETVLSPVLSLYYILRSGRVSIREKAYIIGALGYFILPMDMLPDLIAGLGYTDDIAVILLLLKHLKGNITPEIEAQVETKIKELIYE